MAWSDALLERLADPIRREEVWLLDVVEAYQEPGAGPYVISSAPGYGEDEVLVAEGGPTFTGSRLTPNTWSSTVGTFTVPLAGDIGGLLQHVTRGTTVRIRLGFAGWDESQFEVVGWGQVSNITGAGVSWTLEVRDPIASISNRLAVTAVDLFSDNGNTTTVTGAHTSAVTTITVASTANFQRDTGGSGVGLIKIGSEYITYTGTTGTTFTGCTRGALGTTAAAYVGAEVVTELALLRGHPLDIARRLLVSRVTGNSSWDDYPASWGIGLLQTLIDLDDIDRWATEAVVVSSGSYQWDVAVEGTWDDPGASLASLLAGAGLFLTTRQGLLTVRAGVWPSTTAEPAYSPEYALTDEDIVDGWDGIRQELWASEMPVEYAGISVATNTGSASTSDAIQTLPAAPSLDYDVSDRVFSNESAVRSEMTGRLALLAERIPEALVLTCAGMRLAALAPGDVIPVWSERLASRYANAYTGGTQGRVCLVTQISPDFAANTVQLRLLVFPATSEEFEP